MKFIVFITSVLIMGITIQMTAQEEIIAPKKNILETHKAEIEAIKNDVSLTDIQKQELIKEKRMAIKEQLGSSARGKGKGKGKGYGRAQLSDEERAEAKAQLDAIDNDTSLSEEEKKAAKHELRESLGLGKSRGGGEARGKRKGKGKGRAQLSEEERAVAKTQLQAIDNDTSLSEEEKKVAKSELRESLGINRGGGSLKGKGTARGKGKMIGKSSATDRIQNKISKRTLTSEQIEKAHSRLNKEESKLEKLLKKEKISVDSFNERKAEIVRVRASLNNI